MKYLDKINSPKDLKSIPRGIRRSMQRTSNLYY